MILIGLGANLEGAFGTPEQSLQSCSAHLASRGVFISKSSNIWKSAPVPVSDQPWYRNAICRVETSLSPEDLLTAFNYVEKEAGRVRNALNEARVLDLDIICYDGEILESSLLSLPHPRMHERAFVLFPLQEVAPNWRHVRLDKTVDEMIRDLSLDQKIERIDNSSLKSTYGDKKAV